VDAPDIRVFASDIQVDIPDMHPDSPQPAMMSAPASSGAGQPAPETANSAELPPPIGSPASPADTAVSLGDDELSDGEHLLGGGSGQQQPKIIVRTATSRSRRMAAGGAHGLARDAGAASSGCDCGPTCRLIGISRFPPAGLWFVKDVCGVFCAMFTWFLIFYAEYVVLFIVLIPAPSFAFKWINGVIFHVLILLAFSSHCKAMLSDPGAVPIGNATKENILRMGYRDGKDRVIYKARSAAALIKPERSQPLQRLPSTSCRCILQDGPGASALGLTNNCPLGETNHANFFAIYLTVHYFVLCVGSEWESCASGFSPPATTIFLVFLLVEGVLFGLFTAIMCGEQLHGIINDQTGIENLKRERHSWEKKSRLVSMEAVFGHPFSWRWLSPFSSPNLSNGKHQPYMYSVSSAPSLAAAPSAMSCPPTSAVRIRTYRPTEAEFADFAAYVSDTIEATGGHLAGICKVVPPESWRPRQAGYEDLSRMSIPQPIRQRIVGTDAGAYQLWNETLKSLTLEQYKLLAESDVHRPPARCSSPEQLERKYWASLTLNPPIYGADVSGSVTDADQPLWNMRRLGTLLDSLDQRISGVNTPYLYFGMWKSTFPWHTEDMDLYSINYLHFGAAKHWYAVPPANGRQFERLAEAFFGSYRADCPAFLRHKTSVLSPQLLRRHGVPFDSVVQRQGEFIITFPFGYHCGFNAGFNCAESTNFASRRWIDFGLAARLCRCQPDSVVIDMAAIVRRFGGAAKCDSGSHKRPLPQGRHPAELEAASSSRRCPRQRVGSTDGGDRPAAEAVRSKRRRK
uniref:JmjN domain-containing protein n=1 Tax=Macrostomum lignano TaxID=282301 RepID=A0A1I8I6P5_9PLAT